MAKQKQKQLGGIPSNKNNTPSNLESKLPGEDSWVMVNKQTVRILVPPLPPDNQSTTLDPGPNQSQANSSKPILTESQCPAGTFLQMQVVDEREKSVSPAPQEGNPNAKSLPQPNTLPTKLQRLGNRTGSQKLDQVSNFRRCDLLGLHRSSKLSRQPVRFLSGGGLINQRMRASNLERKLRRAGGLTSWLASMGLDQFVKIFQGKRINKFQLVNLSMSKLKDMGADAVGPRRKLMHAIDCLCQPYCFEASRISQENN
ncbi:hypothetical protein NMG60_11001601 [Bertholletia excelsa]